MAKSFTLYRKLIPVTAELDGKQYEGSYQQSYKNLTVFYGLHYKTKTVDKADATPGGVKTVAAFLLAALVQETLNRG